MKPANILVNSQGQLVLADFGTTTQCCGSSSNNSSGTGSGSGSSKSSNSSGRTQMGSTRYMSPRVTFGVWVSVSHIYCKERSLSWMHLAIWKSLIPLRMPPSIQFFRFHHYTELPILLSHERLYAAALKSAPIYGRQHWSSSMIRIFAV
mmetsp:Transcript_12906/g.21614  ORF Transcript_12906/g.21614 Transcript_12906/m.21614 type:complete len:149 (+) Transcript_12906:792-1238(+)